MLQGRFEDLGIIGEALLFLLADGGVVGIVDPLEELLAQEVVLNLLLGVEVHRVVVSRELVALEELDCSLVELDDDDFVEEAEALDVVL